MCGDDRYVYYFSSDQRSFSAADNECIRRWRGGALARTGLGQLQLCGAENKHYWINFVENNNCEPADSGIYSWRNDKKCRSPNPLRVTRTVTNNNECQALQLSLQSSGSEAIERNCASTARYICQVPRRITTRTIISSIQTTSITSTPFSNESVDTVPSDTIDINPGVIAAIIICCILVLMLFVFLYLWRYKKYDLNKLKNFAITKKPTPTQPAATNSSRQSEDYFYHNSSFSKSAPFEDPSRDIEEADIGNPNGYVTANAHPGVTFPGRDPKILQSVNDVQPYAVAGSSLTSQDCGTSDYWNLSPRDRSVTNLNKKSPLPLFNPDHRDGYATIDTPPTYVILHDPDVGKQEESDATGHYDTIVVHQNDAEDEETAYIKSFN